MKKIYIFLAITVASTSAFAQYKIGGGNTPTATNINPKVIKINNNKAVGDTLFYFDSEGFYLLDPQDNTDFAYAAEDIDGNTSYGSTGWPTPSGDAFQISFYNDDVNETPYTTPGGDFFPNDLTAGTDSAFYIAATSWYNTPAQADNWFNFGPITIPANTTGNTMNWHDKHNPAWTDGYDVYVATYSQVATPSSPSFVDVLSVPLSPLYTRAAINSPTPQPASDTSWTLHSFSLDAFAGQRIFVFFNHDMFDGDVLHLDEFWIEEGVITGIEELNDISFNAFPNPSATGEFTVNLNSAITENVNLTVTNIVGQTIINKNIGVSGQTKETISLADYSKGVYFLTVNNKTVKLISK